MVPKQPTMQAGATTRWACAENEHWAAVSMQGRQVHTCEVCGEGIFDYGWQKVRHTDFADWVVAERHARCLMRQ